MGSLTLHTLANDRGDSNRLPLPRPHRDLGVISFTARYNWRRPDERGLPEQLARASPDLGLAGNRKVTDAFEQALEVCGDLNISRVAQTYTALISALERYRATFSLRLRQRFQLLAEEIGDRFGVTTSGS